MFDSCSIRGYESTPANVLDSRAGLNQFSTNEGDATVSSPSLNQASSPLGRISVVIPTLNEAGALPETLACARRVPEITEVIVVDGGSADATISIAREWGCLVLSHARGRGGQMRAGAARTTGDVVLLLHADTWLPPHAGRAALDSLRDPQVVGGGFWKKFRKPG